MPYYIEKIQNKAKRQVYIFEQLFITQCISLL